MTYQEFINANALELTATEVPSNPCMAGAKGVSHWDCLLARNGSAERFYYSQGSAYRVFTKGDGKHRRGERIPQGYPRTLYDVEHCDRHVRPETPELASVLECLAMDARSFRDCTMDEFAEETGDGIKPSEYVRMWAAMEDNSRKLRRVLGATFDALLECEDE